MDAPFEYENDDVYSIWKNDMVLKDIVAPPANPESVYEAQERGYIQRAGFVFDKELRRHCRIKHVEYETKLRLYWKYNGEYNLVCAASRIQIFPWE